MQKIILEEVLMSYMQYAHNLVTIQNMEYEQLGKHNKTACQYVMLHLFEIGEVPFETFKGLWNPFFLILLVSKDSPFHQGPRMIEP